MKEAVFQHILKNPLCIDFYEIIWSPRMLAETLKITVYKVRKALRELRDEGRVQYVRRVYCNPRIDECHCENHLPIQGWIIPQEIRQTISQSQG